MELPWLGREWSSLPPPVQVRTTSQGNERSPVGPRSLSQPPQLVLLCGFCHERAQAALGYIKERGGKWEEAFQDASCV